MTIKTVEQEGLSAGRRGEPGVSNPHRPLRVMFLVSHSVAGGAQEIWANLAEGFQARGHQVTLAALYPGDTLRETSGMPWLHIVDRRPTKPLAQLAMVRALSSLFRDQAPDIVFTALPAANVLAPLASRLAGGRVRVVTSHHSPRETYQPALDWLDGVSGSLKEVASVIGVSDTVSQSHTNKPRRYRAKLQTIKNALPPQLESLLSKMAAARHDGRARARVVVATGRLASQKNYPVLLRASVHMPDVEIRIIGSGPDEAELKALTERLGVADRVKFLGFHARAAALALLAEGDVFAQPSLFEGHSLALVEAAKLGLPLVVSDAPVQVESITAQDGERCGMVVGVQDDVGLARALLELLDRPDRYAEYRAKAAKLAAGTTYEVMISAYEEIADRALGR